MGQLKAGPQNRNNRWRGCCAQGGRWKLYLGKLSAAGLRRYLCMTACVARVIRYASSRSRRRGPDLSCTPGRLSSEQEANALGARLKQSNPRLERSLHCNSSCGFPLSALCRRKRFSLYHRRAAVISENRSPTRQTMSRKHPIIALPAPPAQGPRLCTRPSKYLPSRTHRAALIEGDSFHRYDRDEMHRLIEAYEQIAARRSATSGRKRTSSRKTGGIVWRVQQARRRHARLYLHNEERAARYGQKSAPSRPGRTAREHRSAVLRRFAWRHRHRQGRCGSPCPTF